jgi:hypothetical protein
VRVGGNEGRAGNVLFVSKKGIPFSVSADYACT